MDSRLKELRCEKSNLKEENDSLIKKLESVLEENFRKTSNLEKENTDLENKLSSVKYFKINFSLFCTFNLNF